MDTDCTNYEIDGWHVQFPQAWKFSMDKNQQPVQIMFDVEEEPVTVYLSTWHWQNKQTGEVADTETVLSFFLQAFAQQGLEKVEEYCRYYPHGFTTCMGRRMTEDGYLMLSAAICTTGSALTVYFVYEEGVEIEKYLTCLRTIA